MKSVLKHYFLLWVCIISTDVLVLAEDSIKSQLEWWRASRFGMFIHWGPVSLSGHEIGWSRGDQVPIDIYDNLYKDFNPTNFNAEQWVKLAKNAGMKYLVFTSRHHDGFFMWDTELSDYNIMHTPFKRDVLKELADACKKHDLVFCIYFSILDWKHPDYPLGSPGGRTKKPNSDMDRYYKFLEAQIKELFRKYGPFGVVWFDGEWEAPWTDQYATNLYRLVKSLQPTVLVNNRVGKGRQGMDGITVPGQLGGDFDTPEQRIGRFNIDRPWESCITLCNQWSWKPNDQLKSLKECIHTLVKTTGGDGNLLLNIGPMPTGEIEPRQATRLLEIGDWLEKYGESIYATRGGPFKPNSFMASTRKDNIIYLHILNWPTNADFISIPKLPTKITKISALTGGSPQLTESVDSLKIQLGQQFRHTIDTIIKLQINRSALEIQPIDLPEK